MAWQSVAEPWLNHGECMYMWVGQRVLCLLQDLFKQGKLSLTLTLTWGNCKGSCNHYNWDSWAPSIALHASRNVAQCLKRLETIQVIMVFIRRTTKSPYILYGMPLKFYPSPHTWRHHASRWLPLHAFHPVVSKSNHLVHYCHWYKACLWSKLHSADVKCCNSEQTCYAVLSSVQDVEVVLKALGASMVCIGNDDAKLSDLICRNIYGGIR